AVAAMAFAAFAASSASATTLEVNGATQNKAVTLTATLDTEATFLLSTTGGAFSNTCKESHVEGTTVSPFSGTTVGGPVAKLSFGKCDPEGVTVIKNGSLTVENIGGTNGTVRSIGAEVKLPQTELPTVNCVTAGGAGTDIGTLTGATNGTTNKTATATLDIHAVLNCGFLLPSALWDGKYVVTTPSELAVSP
ncbi:MAG: hypothetical protein ACJ75T_11850, partial [Solirubrobacterales bacterium]